MKAILSNKTVIYIVIVTLLPYLIAGLSTPAHADNRSALKDAISLEDKVKVSEVKTGEIKAAEATSKTPVDPDFKRLDGNGDGKLSLKEAVKDKALAAQFDATDSNHDGMISVDEYANYKTAPTAKAAEPSAGTPVTN